jgi:four helix bundle protein
MNRESISKNPVLDLAFKFSLEIMQYCEDLEQKRKYTIARQLLRSATSVSANLVEAQNAESRADFIHKCKIAAKESEESQYWLLLCNHSNEYPTCDRLLEKVESLNRLIGKIIITSKKNSH